MAEAHKLKWNDQIETNKRSWQIANWPHSPLQECSWLDRKPCEGHNKPCLCRDATFSSAPLVPVVLCQIAYGSMLTEQPHKYGCKPLIFSNISLQNDKPHSEGSTGRRNNSWSAVRTSVCGEWRLVAVFWIKDSLWTPHQDSCIVIPNFQFQETSRHRSSRRANQCMMKPGCHTESSAHFASGPRYVFDGIRGLKNQPRARLNASFSLTVRMTKKVHWRTSLLLVIICSSGSVNVSKLSSWSGYIW